MAIGKFLIEASHIMMFARSVGDPNPIYYDEEYAKNTDCKGIIPPPTFPQASAQFDPEYGLRPKIGEEWFGSGKEATGLKPKKEPKDDKKEDGGVAMGLHAEQHFEYHKPVLAGDILTASIKPGESWEKDSKRAGKLKFSEGITEYRNQDGELVITARGIGVQTEKPVGS
ncbi:MAG: MaoC family dehydratase N-terminal domain-containing protein [SAR86 cluster bacterium]|jgi:acyl dehydratase|nr:MaoC family dehydratase N-terminal domain-containing protein [SAR86 cluster bacterium]